MSLNDHLLLFYDHCFLIKTNVPGDVYNYASISIFVNSHVGSFFSIIVNEHENELRRIK